MPIHSANNGTTIEHIHKEDPQGFCHLTMYLVCQAIQANPAPAYLPIVICSALKESVIRDQCTYTASLAKSFLLSDLLRLVALHSLSLRT